MPPKIEAHFVYPPIPTRKFDWCATFEGYDGAADAGHQCQGFGPTKEAAIADLLDCWENH